MYALLLVSTVVGLAVAVAIVLALFFCSLGASSGEGIDGQLDSLEESILTNERNLPRVAEEIRDQVSRHINQAKGHLAWARRRASEGNYEMASADIQSSQRLLVAAQQLIDAQ